jgi:3-hydroxy-3-methylglutaryl CoA synthase
LIIERFNHSSKNYYSIDIVQECAGGATAMIGCSQLAEFNKSSVLVVQADAAKKAISKTKSQGDCKLDSQTEFRYFAIY